MEDEIRKTERLNAIVEAVCYWLGYQFKIGRDQLIHEASLRYPIADTITSKGIDIERIKLERLHPIFKGKQIDLVILDTTVKEPDTEENDAHFREVYEFKLAKSQTSIEHKAEHQRVFDDVVRLAYYHFWKNKDCYFMMCGKYEEFKTFFVGQRSAITEVGGKFEVPIRRALIDQQASMGKFEEWKPDGIYKDWFGFQIDEAKEFEFKTTDYVNWGLRPFQSSYVVRNNEEHAYTDKIKIKTKCVAITPSGLENIKTHAAGIWKIEAIK
jgi:hypothetical protein